MRKQYELLSSPRCGDMWALGQGHYALVDYVGAFVGITYDNGIRVGFPTSDDFSSYMKLHEGTNVARWEDGWFTQCADNGFSTGEPISKEVSAAYIYEQLMTGAE